MHRPQVSVVIPLYGQHRGRVTLPAVCRAWLAQDVRCEVVVATAGEIALDLPGAGVRLVVADPALTSPGLLRNVGARSARAATLYLSDADVLPIGPSYLRRALSLRADGVLAQPWMYRLAGFATNPPADLDWQPPRRRACFVTATPDGQLRPVRGEAFFDHRGQLVVVPPPEMADAAESLGWLGAAMPYHYGGALLRRDLFDSVGRYCTRYAGWGSEDDDLLVKLASRARVVRGWTAEPTLACLHLEHPRPYQRQQQANQAVLAERVAAGPTAMIEADGDR